MKKLMTVPSAKTLKITNVRLLVSLSIKPNLRERLATLECLGYLSSEYQSSEPESLAAFAHRHQEIR